MKAEIRQKAGYYCLFLLDEEGNYVGETRLYDTESDARAACLKYFPQFALEGEEKGLPDADWQDNMKNPGFQSKD